MKNEETKEVIPEILIIGAGIAGMQAALDIGDKGFKVHLVEKETCIGGHMAQLDKTFPTLDCSACISTPKMVDTANHPNINLHTYSEIVQVEGKAGHFKVTIRKKPRFVDVTKCTGCGDCAARCPVTLPNEFDMGLGNRKAIYISFPQAVPLKYTMDRRGTSPCTATCPLHCNAHGYVALISQGKFKEALALVKEKLPFPGILAYACSHPCERECKRIEKDRPLSICHLKRFLVDHVEESEFEFTPPQERNQRVAIIGGGPSGLIAAYDLRKMGYSVTVFESGNELGGLLTHGFPSYRLPRQVIEKDLSVINKMGIEVRLNTEVGKDVPAETLLQTFEAIFISVGTAGAESMAQFFHGLKRTRKGSIQVNPISLESNLKGIFAGGDAVMGPSTIIDSMAHGRKAAISIDRYLRGEDLLPGRESEGTQLSPFRSLVPYSKRMEREILPDMVKPLVASLTAEQVVEEAKRCLNCAGCSDCGECAKACQPKAINYEMKEEIVEIHVGSIIVATGFDPFDPKKKPEFGYGVYPNVLQGLEVERLCSASGPTKGEIVIEGKKPKEVIFIHCVGSRDKSVDNEYCSRVCCMYTAKQAHLLRDKVPDAKITVLYMDVRAFGKGFEEFYERVQKEKIIYRRGNPSEVFRKNGKLVVRGEDTLLGEPFEMEADLVVLASGLVPRKEDDILKNMLGLENSSDKFYAEAPGLDPIVTGVDGIFLAGCCQGPKDIPDTVAQASGAASMACAFVAKGRKTEVKS
ncbi:MAG: Cob--CoM heterodisulfide reductase subunit [Deltaproteobacteria bacterium]|jgi:heterodisulfide reductase subunit A-like polyferredoxin|nr:Cob--CoM heterodisulfide reductase subunit [Deltaproteobacteria bacterium]